MRLNPKKWSLATKWSIMLTALALGPLMVAIRFSYEASSTKIVEKTVLALAGGARDTAISLDDAVDERVRQARYLTNLPSVQNYVTSPLDIRHAKLSSVMKDLKATMESYPYLESLDLIDAQGVVIYSTSGNQGVYRDTDLMRTVVTGETYVAGLQQEKDRTEASLVIAAPIGSGAQGGVLRMQSSPRFLTDRVQADNGKQGSGTLGLLLDEQGKVITRSDGAAPWEIIRRSSNSQLTTQDGVGYYTQGATLHAIPWTYVLAVPESALTTELAEHRTQSLILAVAIAMIIGGLARLLALGFTKPLTHMAAATRALAEGRLNFELHTSGRQDEVGQLEGAFKDTYQQLRRLVARMRLSSHLVAEASAHLVTMTSTGGATSGTVSAASEKLAVVAKDLEKQVAHFQV